MGQVGAGVGVSPIFKESAKVGIFLNPYKFCTFAPSIPKANTLYNEGIPEA